MSKGSEALGESVGLEPLDALTQRHLEHFSTLSDYSFRYVEPYSSRMGKSYITRLCAVLRKPSLDAINAIADNYYQEGDYTALYVRGARELGASTDTYEARPELLMAGGVLLLARVIDDLKIKTLGFGHPTTVSNGLTTKITERVAYDFAAAYEYDATHASWAAGRVQTAGERMFLDPEIRQTWAGLKILKFGSYVLRALALQRLMREMEVIDKSETHELAVANDELFQETKILQKYGVKPCIANSYLSSPSVSQWLVERTANVKTNLQQTLGQPAHYSNYQTPRSLALFLSTSGTFNTSVLSYQKTASGPNVLVTADAGVEESSVGASIYLGEDGHLLSEHGMRLDNWADQNNARGEYEQLRAEILSIYFDLVTPNVVAELANIPEDDTAKPLSQDEVQHAETRLQKMRRLVLSRTYVIRTLGIDEIEQLLLEEIEEDRAKTKRNLTTQVQVSGFIRRLPHNFSASAKQRALCLEHMGIVLADHGETYVHDYAYGPDKDPPPKGHKAYFARHSRTRKRQK